MNETTELIFLCGDLHIPMKASDIPEPFKELLAPGTFSHVLCTGNLGTSQLYLDYLKSLGRNLHIVKGEYDDPSSQLPDNKVITVGKMKIGLLHGHQIIPWGDEESLLNYIRENDVDIIVSGHTHEMKASQLENKLFLNPGSFTGTYGPYKLDVEPSFVVLEMGDKSLEAYFYTIVKKEVQISKISYVKGEKIK